MSTDEASPLAYDGDSLEGQFLASDPRAVAEVIRLVAVVIGQPTFWGLRPELTDVHQECMCRIIQSLQRGQFDRARDFRAYVHGIARLTAIETLDRQIRRVGKTVAIEAGLSETAAVDLGWQQILVRSLARVAVQMATPKCRQLIRVYFLEERTYDEVSELLGVPVGTVKSRLFRCLRTAAKTLGAHSRDRPPGARS